MRARAAGAIVLVSSGSASIGEHRRVAYGVSKAAVEQLARHVATRYGRDGIRCNVVAPGFILTGTAVRGVPRRAGPVWPPRTRSAAWARPRTSPTPSASSCPTGPGS